MLKERLLVKKLIARKATLAIAESCTGGLLANRITNIPGSSKTLLLGITAYSDSAKNKLLRIPKSLIRTKGAVSPEVAGLMSKNAIKLSGSDFGIGITGIAGPSGGSRRKPTGTVFIAVTSSSRVSVKKFCFAGGRLQVKKKSTDRAMDMLLDLIE